MTLTEQITKDLQEVVDETLQLGKQGVCIFNDNDKLVYNWFMKEFKNKPYYVSFKIKNKPFTITQLHKALFNDPRIVKYHLSTEVSGAEITILGQLLLNDSVIKTALDLTENDFDVVDLLGYFNKGEQNA